MRTQVRLSSYERGIAEALTTSFGLTAEAARKLVVQYIHVIRKLGGYDSCYDHADRLVQSQKAGLTPEMWLDRIQKIDREAAKDRGIPYLEQTGFVHVR